MKAWKFWFKVHSSTESLTTVSCTCLTQFYTKIWLPLFQITLKVSSHFIWTLAFGLMCGCGVCLLPFCYCQGQEELSICYPLQCAGETALRFPDLVSGRLSDSLHCLGYKLCPLLPLFPWKRDNENSNTPKLSEAPQKESWCPCDAIAHPFYFGDKRTPHFISRYTLYF